MAWRWTLTCPLLAALVVASGCPEPGEDEGGSADEVGGETGDSQGDTGDVSQPDRG